MKALEIAGLVLITTAAGLVAIPLGCAAAGIACLVLSWAGNR